MTDVTTRTPIWPPRAILAAVDFGEASTRAVSVAGFIAAGGTATLPVLKFSSSPPRNSEQVLLLVMAGETPNSEMSYSGNQRAVRFGAFLGKSLFSNVSAGSS